MKTAFLILIGLLFASKNLPTKDFKEVIIDSQGPKSCWTKTLGDLNGDGKVDLIVGGNVSGGIVWYEAPGWKKHQITENKRVGTDGETADMDGDGDIDLVNIFNRTLVLFENPRWKEHLIDNVVLHDIELDDFDGDGLIDIAGRNQAEWGKGDTLFLYKQYSPDEWEKIKINIVDGEGLKCSDLNNDGKKDLIINGYWLENTGDIHKWSTHRFSDTWNWKNTFISVGDFNNDGRKDIVMSPSEREGHVYRLSWFEGPSDPAGLWKEHIVRDSIETIVHFVDACDFNTDGNVDIVTAEMTQGKDPDEIAVYFNQRQGKGWEKEVISTGGSHSMRLGDFDQDGNIDLFGANWQEDTVKMWINQIRPQNHIKVNKR